MSDEKNKDSVKDYPYTITTNQLTEMLNNTKHLLFKEMKERGYLHPNIDSDLLAKKLVILVRRRNLFGRIYAKFFSKNNYNDEFALDFLEQPSVNPWKPKDEEKNAKKQDEVVL